MCVYLAVPDTTLLRRRVAKVGDEDEELAWESLKTFHRHVKPVLDEFKKRDKLVEITCHAAEDADQVFEKVLVSFKEFFQQLDFVEWRLFRCSKSVNVKLGKRRIELSENAVKEMKSMRDNHMLRIGSAKNK